MPGASRRLLNVLLFSCCLPSLSQAAEVNRLVAALRSARPGAVIALPPGIYQGNALAGLRFSPAVTITSADRAHPATLKDLTIQNSSGLDFRNLEFSTADDPPGPRGAMDTIPFQVTGCAHLLFSQIKVHGDPNGSLATDETGLEVRNSSYVTVEGSEFSHLHNAFYVLDDDHVAFTNNYCHDLRDDCFHGGGTSWLQVTWNRADSNHPDGKADPDHPDFIQLWGRPTKGDDQAHDILIAHNFYRRGRGTQTQGIFVQTEPQWHIPPMRNVRITGNVILGAQYNGITVQGAAPGTEIDHNIVRGHNDMRSWIFVRDSAGVDLHDNVGELFYIEAKSTSNIHEAHDQHAGPVGHDEEALAAQWERERTAAVRDAK